jgi:hypothetical protein
LTAADAETAHKVGHRRCSWSETGRGDHARRVPPKYGDMRRNDEPPASVPDWQRRNPLGNGFARRSEAAKACAFLIKPWRRRFIAAGKTRHACPATVTDEQIRDAGRAMPWNETDRVKYAVIRERYASDLSDEEFALVQP